MSHDIHCADHNEPKEIMSMHKFHIVQIWLDNGKTWITNVNPKCTEREVVNYFLGQMFDAEPFPSERKERCVAVRVSMNHCGANARETTNSSSKSMQKRLRVLRGEEL